MSWASSPAGPFSLRFTGSPVTRGMEQSTAAGGRAKKKTNSNKVKISIFAKRKDIIMLESIDQSKGKTKITITGLPFEPKRNQVFFYDPQGSSEYSQAVENNLGNIKKLFLAYGYDFCFFPELAKGISEEMIRYSFPNWNGQPLKEIGNDLLKPYIAKEDQDIGACFIRHYYDEYSTFSCYQLTDFQNHSVDFQVTDYRQRLLDSEKKHREAKINADSGARYSVTRPSNSEVMFSVTNKRQENLVPVYEKKISLADECFATDSVRLEAEIRELAGRLHQEGISEFVLRCMVPIDKKLSRLVITSNYNIVLPDYGNMIIEMSPLPKTVFLLFLKHPEGIYFKDLVDYKDEIRHIYGKITNRISALVIGKSIEQITDPTQNAINEKCSRIREAFIKHIDNSLAESYYISGTKSQAKRITLPRNLVEWQCEL